MNILDDMGVNKLSGFFYYVSELILQFSVWLTGQCDLSGFHKRSYAYSIYKTPFSYGSIYSNK